MNRNRLFFIFLAFLITFPIVSAQEYWLHGRWKHIRIDNLTSISVDTITHDTIFENMREGLRKIISTKGVLVSEGHIGGCGCESEPHGYWINRNRDNSLKELGMYHCNYKIGTWYYFENNLLSKIENYSEAYPDFFPDWNQNSVIDLLETQEAGLSGLDLVWNNRIGWKRKMKTFLSGPYVEFYQGGQIRTEGYYRILEVFSNADTTLIFNPETYEDEMIITNGEFWFPRSFKYGTWKFYNPNGTIRKKRHYNVPTNGNAIRLLELGSLTSKDY